MSYQLRYDNGNLLGLPQEIIERMHLNSGDLLEATIDEAERLIVSKPTAAEEEEDRRLLVALHRSGLYTGPTLPPRDRPPAWIEHPEIRIQGEPLSQTVIQLRDGEDD
jgi:hypothetical protein